MKYFLIIICLIISIPVFADTMPFYTNSIPKTALGLYQTDKTLVVYSSPDINSHITKKIDFSYMPETMPDGMFAVLINEKKLGFLYVTDIGDDNWIEIIYDKRTGAIG